MDLPLKSVLFASIGIFIDLPIATTLPSLMSKVPFFIISKGVNSYNYVVDLFICYFDSK